MRYPHLPNSSDFPNAENVNVYDYATTFDYSRWDETTKVKLLRVPWRESPPYNVIYWENDQKRNDYFQKSDGYEIELTTPSRMQSDGSIKVSVPFDVANRYNYVWVHYPIATSEGEPIEHEVPGGVRDMFYFLESTDYAAPSTTRLMLSLDVWTTYVNSLDFGYAMLTRGHAPADAVTPDKFLENPIGNGAFLMAPDVDYGNAGIVRHAAAQPVGGGRKVVLFAIPKTRADLAATSAGALGAFTAPVYSDTGDRWGEQYQVDGYAWGGGTGVSNPTSDAVASANPYTLSGLHVFGIFAQDANAFFSALAGAMPLVFKQIRAAFLTGGAALLGNVEDTFELTVGSRTFELFEMTAATDSIQRFEIGKGMFGFDDRAAQFAKLYTSPYSRVEITTPGGNVISCGVEETGGELDMYEQLAVVGSSITGASWITGIGAPLGSGTDTWIWWRVNGAGLDYGVSASQWQQTLYAYSIPTFEVSSEAYNFAMPDLAYKGAQQRLNALQAYHTGVRSANTGQMNTIDSSNAGKANADASANTAKANADASANTAKANADASANSVLQNAKDAATARTVDTNMYSSFSNASTATSNYLLGEQFKNAADLSIANIAQSAITSKIQTESGIFNTGVNSGTSILNEIMGDVKVGKNAETARHNSVVSVGLSVAGGLFGGLKDEISLGNFNDVTIANFNKLYGGLNTADHLWDSYSDVFAHYTQPSYVTSDGLEAVLTRLAVEQNGINLNNGVVDYNARNSNANSLSIGGKLYTASHEGRNYITTRNGADLKGNDSRTNETALANNERTNSNSLANNQRTNETELANNERTNRVAVDNADYSEASEVLSQKGGLETAQEVFRLSAEAYKAQPAVSVGTQEGDMWQDALHTREYEIRIVTETDGAIMQAANQFARYGYALGQEWKLGEWVTPGKRFDFWQCEYSNVTSAGAPQSAVDFIDAILREGITVWRNPEDIGKVSIFDRNLS